MVMTLADLSGPQAERARDLGKKYQNAYFGVYNKYNLPNYNAALELQKSNPSLYGQFKNDIYGINRAAGQQYSANKGSGGLFGGGILGKIAGFALPAIGFAVGGPLGSAIGSGVGSLASGGSIKDALLSGGLSYAGGAIGGKLFPDSIGSLLGSKNALGPYAFMSGGSMLGNAANALANTSIGSVIGGFAGNSLANSMRSPQQLVQNQVNQLSQKPTPFIPSRQPQLDLPGGLAGLSGLTPEQQSSNIATQGVYGSGGGPQEQSYFQNLINRRLVDQSGKVDQDLSEVNPIENSYLAQMGLGGYSNPSSLLEAMSKWKAA